MKAKISEVGTSDVKYKKFDNLTGPTFTTAKTDLFMIKYANGTKDVFGSLGNTGAPNGYDNDTHSRSIHFITTGGVLTGLGGAFIISGGIMFGVATVQADSYYNTGYGNAVGIGSTAIAGLTFMCVSVPFLIAGPICIGKGKGLQRRERNNQASLSIGNNGGIAINF